ncbi:MAG: SPOR domain-containing protein [Magnetococcales bacterium]|nr:SPOR domain-containing protein [Magnetococcales bacterium]
MFKQLFLITVTAAFLLTAGHSVQAEDEPFNYAVQVASYRKLMDAEERLLVLRDMGLQPYVVRIFDQDQRPWHTVMVGRFAGYSKARQKADALQDDYDVDAFVQSMGRFSETLRHSALTQLNAYQQNDQQNPVSTPFKLANQPPSAPLSTAPVVNVAAQQRRVVIRDRAESVTQSVAETSDMSDTVQPAIMNRVDPAPSLTKDLPVSTALNALPESVEPIESSSDQRETQFEQISIAPETAKRNNAMQRDPVIMRHGKNGTQQPVDHAAYSIPQEPGQPILLRKRVKGNQTRADKLYQKALNEQGTKQEDLLQRVLKSWPDHRDARWRLARLMASDSRHQEALTVLAPMVGNNPGETLALDDPGMAEFVASLYQQTGSDWKAVALFEALLRRSGGSRNWRTADRQGVWWMGVAISLERLGERNEALSAYRKSLQTGQLSQRLRAFVKGRIQSL